MNEKQMQALLKKTQAKAAQKAAKSKPSFDPTLEATRPKQTADDSDASDIFRTMKKREF
ncbi:MAG: hypothetical protein ACK53A_10675 [Gemmatimonadota bacterium]|jgi:hypothetical protein|nr:hypothetical protein [Gemmatimonadota bacterium]